MPCKEGEDGEVVKPDHAYVAPGDFHMSITGNRDEAKIRLTQGPPINYCRPSVDPSLESVVRTYGARALGVILTGMGHDGLNGGKALAAAGGSVIAQDEDTSVVWGMPGAVATAGVCCAVLPVSNIASRIDELAGEVGR